MATLLLRYSLCFDRDGCRFMINRQHACHRIDEQTKMAKAHCACAVWHDSIGERSHWLKWGQVTWDATSDLCTDTGRDKYPAFGPSLLGAQMWREWRKEELFWPGLSLSQTEDDLENSKLQVQGDHNLWQDKKRFIFYFRLPRQETRESRSLQERPWTLFRQETRESPSLRERPWTSFPARRWSWLWS